MTPQNDTSGFKTAQPSKSTAILSDVTAVILAGGQGQRMGGQDKGLVNFSGQPMVQHIIKQIQPNVQFIMINANRNLAQYQSLGFPVIEDIHSGYQGPLMGMLTGLTYAQTEWVLFLPCDTPILPSQLIKRLYNAATENQADVAVAHDGEYLQPVVALVKRTLAPSLEQWLNDGKRKIDRWFMQHRMIVVSFAEQMAYPPLMNLNTSEELQEFELLQSKINAC